MTVSSSIPQISVANKAPGTEGQQQAHGEKKETPAVPSAPPSYEEATSGEGLKAGAFPPAPSAVPLHPSWAYVDPSKSLSPWSLEHHGELWAQKKNLGRRKLPINRCIVCLLYEALLSKAWDLEGHSKGRLRRTPWKGRDTIFAVTVLLDGEEGIHFKSPG